MPTLAPTAPRARPGRRPNLILTPKRVKTICDLVEKGVPQAAAAGSVGIPRRTYQQWLAKGREDGAPEPYASLADRIEEALDRFHASRAVIVSESTDDRIALQVLERRFKDDWAPADRGGSTTVNVQVVIERERRDLGERASAAALAVWGDDPRLELFLAALAGGDVVEGEIVREELVAG